MAVRQKYFLQRPDGARSYAEMAKGKETQMQQKNDNVNSKQVHENMVKLRLRRKRDEDRQNYGESFQKKKKNSTI